VNRKDFQELARIRIREAKALLDAKCFHGAYYLAGYAVECALKACVARRVRRHDFPDREMVKKAYTHNLQDLVKVAELNTEFDSDKRAIEALRVNWSVVKDWNEGLRYETAISEGQARDMYSACTTRRNGVLPWIRKRW